MIREIIKFSKLFCKCSKTGKCKWKNLTSRKTVNKNKWKKYKCEKMPTEAPTEPPSTEPPTSPPTDPPTSPPTDPPTSAPTDPPVTSSPTEPPTTEGSTQPFQASNPEGLECNAGEPCPSYFEDFANLDDWDIHDVPDSYNNEYQYYTSRKKNVRTEDGYLKIRPFREQYEHREYTSGKITSKHFQKYGRIEVRAKHPAGRGLWPAIWMMPQEKSKSIGS